ncbi:MAG: cation:proton antiporter [Bacteroidales bacterium]|jgi:predicted Kef-type K+ transport protein|nr:cation:proton antiporter [Bacteroidales bacterium]
MEALWLAIAFLTGFGARLIKLPPLIGYLIAGFILNYLGAESGVVIETISDLGIILLLFTIGLKLKVKRLLKKEIWAGTLIQIILFVIILTSIFYLLSYTPISYFNPFHIKTTLLLAFAFSFSSTVFAVKVLEEKGELSSFYGIMAIGVLVIQDIIAVIFMVFETGELPNIYALGLPLLLLLIRPLLFKILDMVGHGELLILFGLFLAFIVGAELFYLTGLKPDLGALIAGMLIANHKKAKDLSDTLMGFKDIFLIGFFLSIGLSGKPTTLMLITSLIIALTINFKVILYFFVFTRFRLRARSALFTSLSLANFSEFGLIISSLGVASGWLSNDWLIIMALSLSVSFVISSPLNLNAQKIYSSIKQYLAIFETSQRLAYDKTYDIGDAEILIFGMGRIGRSTYDHLKNKYGKTVLGLDYDENVVKANQREDRNIIQDDATDSEFWQRIPGGQVNNNQVKIVIFCMDHKSNLYAIERLKAIHFQGMIAATAEYSDELQELKQKGVHLAFDQKAEAGMGFANHVCQNMEVCNIN